MNRDRDRDAVLWVLQLEDQKTGLWARLMVDQTGDVMMEEEDRVASHGVRSMEARSVVGVELEIAGSVEEGLGNRAGDLKMPCLLGG